MHFFCILICTQHPIDAMLQFDANANANAHANVEASVNGPLVISVKFLYP